MLNDKDIRETKATLIFIVGVIVMLISSVVWVNLPKEYGEQVALCGQTLGQIAMCFTVFLLSKNRLLSLFSFYIIWLGIYDIIDIIFFQPFEISLGKFASFVFATVILILRLGITRNNNG